MDSLNSDMMYEVGKTINLAPMFDKLGYTCDSPELLQVTFTKETQHLDLNYTFINVTEFNVQTPSRDSEHEINHEVEIIAHALPVGTLEQEWHLEAVSGVEVNGHNVKGIQVGKVEFNIVSTERPSVKQLSSFIVIDSSEVEGFSLDNTKEELQKELDKQGVSYKQSETKKQLLDKIGV